jgi:hydroxypyruvate isomerase
MIAIHTRCLPVTNTRGTRIKAFTASGFEATIAYPYAESYEKAHFEAVKALIEKHKLDWNLENMRFGDSADGKGYVFCFDHSRV